MVHTIKELSIGQMARLNEPPEQALRLYDKAELLSPIYWDTENGHYYYDIRQSAQLGMTQHMKTLGMLLKDIKEQLTHPELDMFKIILRQNLEELELRSRELMYQRRAIERTLENYEWYENAPPDGTTVPEYIPGRLTYMTGSEVDFYDYDIDMYERILRDPKKNLVANQFSPIYFYNAGTVMRREYLMEGKYYSTEIFMLADRGFVKDSLVTEIPASTHLYIYCNGFEKEKEYTGRLVEEIRARDYQVTGDRIYKVVAEVPMNMWERGVFLRLQVPVSFRRNNP